MAQTRKEYLQLKVDLEGLGPEHVRALRSLVVHLQQILTTSDEAEFFDGSAECMRLCASLIKRSRFSEGLVGQAGILYAEQALEFSMDTLQDQITLSKVINYDN